MWLPMVSKCCDCGCLWLTRPKTMDPGVSVAVDIECEVDLTKAGDVYIGCVSKLSDGLSVKRWMLLLSS